LAGRQSLRNFSGARGVVEAAAGSLSPRGHHTGSRGGRVPHRAPQLRLPAALRRALSRLAVALAVLALGAGPLALSANAVGGLTMNARLLLQGHARAGSWAAVEVDLQNDGPGITGELRMDGGSQANARYAIAVSLPTNSRQTYVLHVQPPAFGRTVKVDLVSGDQIVDSVSVAYLVHDATQLVVGVLAERPQALISQIDLPPNAMGAAAAIVPLTVADLPERAEGWAVLDRLIWQDVDSNQLKGEQLKALRQWLAGGGRLVIVGGSAGIGTLSAFPDDLLPYRPTATLDLDPASLISLLGPLPTGAGELPAMAGALTRGRALATSGDRAVAAELQFGSGRVTLLGFDPTTRWLAESKSIDTMWRAALPGRSSDGAQLLDDSQLVQSVYQLPSLALPPTSGLLILIGAYILIIGPINYFVLKRMDRRELAWITMPLLVLAFTAASFGYGFLLRGTDVVVNEVAIVRGAPNATEATAQVYFGVFSPTRATYQVAVPQGALLASPINGDPFGQGAGTLDIVQGTGPERPSMVRNLAVGTSSLRVVRAELPVAAPRMKAELTLENNSLTGTFENDSDEKLENVAIVLGSAAASLGDVDPHATVTVSLPVRDNPFGAPLADQIVGSSFEASSEAGVRRTIRYGMINQLTYDPTGQLNGSSLSVDQAVILAFGRSNLLDVQLGAQEPRRTANVLYYVPVGIGIHGPVTFSSDLLRSTIVDSDGQLFSKDRFFLNMGLGSATMSYKPIPFDGTFTVSQIRIALGQNANLAPGGGAEIAPLPTIPVACTDAAHSVPAGCQAPRNDFLPEVEVFDRSGEGAWVRLPRLSAEVGYTLAEPARYVDPASGQLLVRFLNEAAESDVNFSFQVALVGDVQ
jgi:hypothetical protein